MASTDMLPLQANVVDVWRVDHDLEESVARRLLRTLSQDERQRADRFLLDKIRYRFVVRRAALRGILAGYLNCPPQELQLHEQAFGKPVLAGPCPGAVLHFNVSGSGSWALVAVGSGGPLGVDIEQRRPVGHMERLCQRICTASEWGIISGMDEAERLLAFFRLWTRKEAVAKGLGVGLSLPLDVVEVGLDQSTVVLGELPANCRRGDASSSGMPRLWSLVSFEAEPGYSAALATSAAAPALRFRRWVVRKQLNGMD